MDRVDMTIMTAGALGVGVITISIALNEIFGKPVGLLFFGASCLLIALGVGSLVFLMGPKQ